VSLNWTWNHVRKQGSDNVGRGEERQAPHRGRRTGRLGKGEKGESLWDGRGKDDGGGAPYLTGRGNKGGKGNDAESAREWGAARLRDSAMWASYLEARRGRRGGIAQHTLTFREWAKSYRVNNRHTGEKKTNGFTIIVRNTKNWEGGEEAV